MSLATFYLEPEFKSTYSNVNIIEVINKEKTVFID